MQSEPSFHFRRRQCIEINLSRYNNSILWERSLDATFEYVEPFNTRNSNTLTPSNTVEGPAIWGLRQDSRVLKIPPYLSLLLILIGIGWLLVLPLNEYSRYTYVSESALLPEQVSTYFGDSEHTIFRAYRHEVAALQDKSGTEYDMDVRDEIKS